MGMGTGIGMGMRVLVVDDEALARSRLRSLLGDCGAGKVQQVDEAANANAAIRSLFAEVKRVDAIIPRKLGTARLIKTASIDIVTINSIRVKPRDRN